MSRFDSPLDNLRIASPCSADWNAMQGDERKRFCGGCMLNVYNLSGMTRYDAEHLLRLSEGRLCVRYFQRADGTVLTRDCPVGWARVKQRVSILAATVFSLVVSYLQVSSSCRSSRNLLDVNRSWVRSQCRPVLWPRPPGPWCETNPYQKGRIRVGRY